MTLSGSMTIEVGNGATETIQIGSGTSGNGTFYTGTGSGSNGLAGVMAAINAAAVSTPIAYTAGASGDAGSLTAINTSILTGATPQLQGQLTIQAGAASSQIVDMNDVNQAEGGTTLSNIADYINNNDLTLGVDATVADNGDGTSTLSLSSASSAAAPSPSVPVF